MALIGRLIISRDKTSKPEGQINSVRRVFRRRMAPFHRPSIENSRHGSSCPACEKNGVFKVGSPGKSQNDSTALKR
jgi:hypothetical protein